MNGVVRAVTAPDGGHLRVEDVAGGDGAGGAPLVLTHGAFADRAAFRRLRPLLGTSRRLLLPVLRGHEDTGTALGPDYGIDTSEVADLVAVLDACEIERASFLAHSSSGAVALALALAHPERVDRLVLIEPTVLCLVDAPTFEGILASTAEAIAASERGDHAGAAAGLLQFIAPRLWASLDEPGRARAVGSLNPFGAMIGPHTRALLRYRVDPADLARLSAPTVLVYGGDSLPFEPLIAAGFATLRPDIEQVHVDGAGHNVHLDQPAAVATVVARFLP